MYIPFVKNIVLLLVQQVKGTYGETRISFYYLRTIFYSSNSIIWIIFFMFLETLSVSPLSGFFFPFWKKDENMIQKYA